MTEFDGISPQETSNSFKVVNIKPSELTPDDYTKLHLEELLVRGYGVDYPDPAQRVRDAFGGEDAKKEIFLAMNGERAVSTLVLSRWSADDNNRGTRFWDTLKRLDPTLAINASNYSPFVYAVAELVTHPDFLRNHAIRQIIDQANQKVHPGIIVGRTKTPGAVRARAESWKNMSTYYGNYNITPGADMHDSRPGTILSASYIGARDDEVSNGFIFVPTTVNPPYIPDTSQMPPAIKEAFLPVINLQKELGQQKTVLQPLVSISNDILAHG